MAGIIYSAALASLSPSHAGAAARVTALVASSNPKNIGCDPFLRCIILMISWAAAWQALFLKTFLLFLLEILSLRLQVTVPSDASEIVVVLSKMTITSDLPLASNSLYSKVWVKKLAHAKPLARRRRRLSLHRSLAEQQEDHFSKFSPPFHL